MLSEQIAHTNTHKTQKPPHRSMRLTSRSHICTLAQDAHSCWWGYVRFRVCVNSFNTLCTAFYAPERGRDVLCKTSFFLASVQMWYGVAPMQEQGGPRSHACQEPIHSGTRTQDGSRPQANSHSLSSVKEPPMHFRYTTHSHTYEKCIVVC